MFHRVEIINFELLSFKKCVKKNQLRDDYHSRPLSLDSHQKKNMHFPTHIRYDFI